MARLRSFLRLLGRRLPVTGGRLRVPGPRGEIVIRRDRNGIPHIEAGSTADAAFAVGFVQAQDRAFQLEVLRRVCHGTVAELVGTRGLAIDHLSRRIGFARAARRQLPNQSSSTREQIEGFAAGVCAGFARGLTRPPHELALLRRRPTPWEAADVLCITKLVGFMLSTSWNTKVARLEILRQDGPDALCAVEPGYPAHHPVSTPPGGLAGPAVERLAAELATLEGFVGTGLSNNWVVGGARTISSRPIVANDPHLNPAVPSQWYLAHVRTPEWEAAGAMFAGAPGFAAGHNGTAAWGVTNGLADLVDLWIEDVGPDGRSVRRGDRWVPCEVLVEEIRVRGQKPVTEVVLVTDRGPIIGPALDGEHGAVSFNASWLSDGPLEGFLEAQRRTTFAEFRAAFAAWPAASLNVVYGDTSGEVGWQFAGILPSRPSGRALLPLDAADPRSAWGAEPVPFAAMPWASGGMHDVLVTANSKPVSDDEAPYLGADWTMGYRTMRIREALLARRDWDARATLALQMDVTSIPWREIRDVVLDSDPGGDADAAVALGQLRAWDGQLTASSVPAAIFAAFCEEITCAIVRAKAPRSADWALGRGAHRIVPFSTYHTRRLADVVRLLREQPEGWLQPGWPAEIRRSLGAAVSRLRAKHGADPASWAWGRVRPLRVPHLLGGPESPLGRLFDLGPLAVGGDITTVAMCGSNPTDVFANPVLLATFRMAIPVGDWEEARFVLLGGQSGNPLSPHYDDMLPLWERGEGVPIPWSPQAVQAATIATLRLDPTTP